MTTKSRAISFGLFKSPKFGVQQVARAVLVTYVVPEYATIMFFKHSVNISTLHFVNQDS